MLAVSFDNVFHDRTHLRDSWVNLAIRWFAGYRIDEPLPNRSNLTRIWQLCEKSLFRKPFTRTVKQCKDAGLISVQIVHINATLIRVDVNWDSPTTDQVN